MGLISSSAISAIVGVDPAAIQQAAAGIRTSAAQIRNDGQQVVGAWKGLSAFYHAPESGQLIAAMTPLQTETDQFASQAEQVAAALDEFATTVAALKTKLNALGAQAQTLLNQQSNDPNWHTHQTNVNAENALIAQVNAAQTTYQAAEIRCANRINALDGGPQYAPGSPTNPNGVPAGMTPYGLTTIPTGTPTPWGTPSQKSPTWWESALHILWGGTKGIAVDGIWGTIQSLPGLVHPSSWSNLYNLGQGIDPWTYLAGRHQAHASAQAWKNFAKGLIAYDEWHKDYGRAAGIVVFNAATLGIAELKLGKLGKLGKIGDLGPAGKTLTLINRATDPLYITRLGIKGTTYLGDKTSDLIKIHANNLTDLEHLTEELHATPSTPKATSPLPSVLSALDAAGHPTYPHPTELGHRPTSTITSTGETASAAGTPEHSVGGSGGHLSNQLLKHERPPSVVGERAPQTNSGLNADTTTNGAKPGPGTEIPSRSSGESGGHSYSQPKPAPHDAPTPPARIATADHRLAESPAVEGKAVHPSSNEPSSTDLSGSLHQEGHQHLPHADHGIPQHTEHTDAVLGLAESGGHAATSNVMTAPGVQKLVHAHRGNASQRLFNRLFPKLRNVNPNYHHGGRNYTQNCQLCVVVVEHLLTGGDPLSAIGRQPINFPNSILSHVASNGAFHAVTGYSEIINKMTDAGDGARGIIHGMRLYATGGYRSGHVFNVVNRSGRIYFIDGQVGGWATLEDFNAYEFVRTN